MLESSSNASVLAEAASRGLNDSSSRGLNLKGLDSSIASDLGLSGSERPGNWSSQASWRRRQSEHEVIAHCRRVFDSLQNVPEKSELQSHVFKLEKAVQQIYTSRVEGNAKLFKTCSHVVADLEAACTLFELELPKHIAELKALGKALMHHAEVSKTTYLWRVTQFLSNSTLRRIKVRVAPRAKSQHIFRTRAGSRARQECCGESNNLVRFPFFQEFNRYLNEAMGIEKALHLRLVVHDFSQWNARASNHLVSGSPLNKLLLVTFRLRKLSIPERLKEDLDDVEDAVQTIATEVLPQDDEGFEEYLSRCRECTERVSGVVDSIIAGKEVFGVQQSEIDSCLSQMKLLRQTNTTMEETPKSAIAVVEALQDILVSMNQVNILVRGMQAFFKIKLRQKEDAHRVNLYALFNLLVGLLSALALIGGAVLLVLGILGEDQGMTSIGIAMLASTILIYLVLVPISWVKKKSNNAILPVTSTLPVKSTLPVVKKSKAKKKVKTNAVAPLTLEVPSVDTNGPPAAKEKVSNHSEATAAGTENEAQEVEEGRAGADPSSGSHGGGSVSTSEATGPEASDQGKPREEIDEQVLKEEVVRYAIHLGLDPEEDTDLFWIAEQAYHAHLPSNWAQYSDDKGNLYYYNKVTGISSWSHPLEDQFRSLYAQMKSSKERFGPLASASGAAGGANAAYNPQRAQTANPTESAMTSDNESEYESDGSRFETSRDSFSSSFMDTYLSSLRSPREDHSQSMLTNSHSDLPQNRSYTSGVTGKKAGLVLEGGSSVNLDHIPRSKFSESSPGFRKNREFQRNILERSHEDLPISARPLPTAFLASLSDSSAGRSMQKALEKIMSNM